MKPLRLSIAQAICRYLPPLIGQRARSVIYPQSVAFFDDYAYITTAQTGSKFSSTTSDFHGYPFAVYGYFNWRAWAIALAVCNPGDTIIEVGANIGTETVGFADIVGCDGKVVAFEPLPDNCDSLLRVLELHKCKNIVIQPFALGGTNGSVRFKKPNSKHMSGIGHVVTGDTSETDDIIQIECRTLDSMSRQIGPAKLIFLDTEGAEHSIVQGAQQYLETFTPTIVLEAGPRQLALHGLSLQDLFDTLVNMNYNIFDISRFGLTPVDPSMFSTSTSDWLCIHASQHTSLMHKIKKSLRLCGWMPCISLLNPITRKSRKE